MTTISANNTDHSYWGVVRGEYSRTTLPFPHPVKSQDNHSAITDCNQALKLDPTFTNSYYNRGLAYENKGSKDKALKDFKKVLELNDHVKLSQKAKQQLQQLGTK